MEKYFQHAVIHLVELLVWGDLDVNSSIRQESSIDISLVFPAYNEEKRLPSTIESTLTFMKKWATGLNLTYEIIIVDDGSKDHTVDVVLAYMKENSNIRLLKLAKNRGKGGAVTRGVSRSRGSYILMVDADGATDIRDLEKLYTAIQRPSSHSQTQTHRDSSQLSKSSDCPVGAAIGSRAHLEKNSIANRALHRTILMYGLHLLVMIFCTRKVKDTQCGFKLFTKETARIIFPILHLERWSFDIELIYLMDMMNIPMIEVAVNWEEVPGSKLIEKTSDILFVSLNMLRFPDISRGQFQNKITNVVEVLPSPNTVV
eukprot:gene5587-11263_t